jgi:hypothetical protein
MFTSHVQSRYGAGDADFSQGGNGGGGVGCGVPQIVLLAKVK